MQLLACGISHKTAPLSIREKLVFNQADINQSLVSLIGQTTANEAAILSTCNRTEVYCTSKEAESVIHWLHQYQQLPRASFEPHLYIYQDQSAVQHIMRVASGLDSMVLGEPQILGQLKTAFAQADKAGTLGRQLRHLSQYVFSASKKIRTETAIGVHPVSVASAAIDLAKRIFADINQMKVLCVGAGDTIELVGKYLQKSGVKNFWVANRTSIRAEKLAADLGGLAISLDQITDVLPKVDIVIAATASSLPIIGKGAVERALKKRKRRPMFMVDLAVPRDIEPEVATLSDIYLYTLDDLQATIQQNLSERQEAATTAENMITQEVNCFMRSLQTIEASSVIRSYREQAENLRDQELTEALQLLQSQSLPMEEILERLAYRLTNKLLHNPTQQLRLVAMNEDYSDNGRKG